MVMVEMEKPRDTFIKIRGQYDKNGDKVTANTPHFLPPLPSAPANGKRYTRLDLAKWLVSPEQPLVARVEVNRIWAIVFGTGLVKTVNDFGSQGEWPSHPELLDWLAADFMRDWNIKRVVKQMVMSSTYCQSSRVTRELLERDSANRLLAHGPRNRLDAEFIRDNALAISGLLNPEICGEPVFPIQPPGIWEVNEAASPQRQLEAGARRPAISPGDLHLPSPQHALSLDAHLRRPQPRSLHGQPGALEHAVAVAGADERSGLRRSRPRPGPAHAEGKPALDSTTSAYRLHVAAGSFWPVRWAVSSERAILEQTLARRTGANIKKDTNRPPKRLTKVPAICRGPGRHTDVGRTGCVDGGGECDFEFE